MKHRLSTTQIEYYRENGFLVVEDWLDPDELKHWQSVTQEAVDQRMEQVRHGANRSDTNAFLANHDESGESYYAQVFTQCVKLWETHDGMKELMLDPRLGEMAGALSGLDGIRLWHDQALFKPPFGNPTGWHLDNPYWSFDTRDTLSLWVALDDATLSNGCLYYIPGSHKTATWNNSGIGENMADLFKIYPEWRAINPVACPCPAGSVVIHNGLTAHGAGANMTNQPRRAMTCGYLPDGATFNGKQNILPDAYFQSLTIGDALDNDTLNPVLWRRG